MEVLLHWIYVVALKDARASSDLRPGELVAVGFWNLVIVWLKVRSSLSLFHLRSDVWRRLRLGDSC